MLRTVKLQGYLFNEIRRVELVTIVEDEFWEKLVKESKVIDNKLLNDLNTGKIDIFSEYFKLFIKNECAMIAKKLVLLQKITSRKNNAIIAAVLSSVIIDSSKNFDEAFHKLEEFKREVKAQLIALDKFNNDTLKESHRLIGERRIGVCKHTNQMIEQEYDGVSDDSKGEFGWLCLHCK